MNRRRVNAGTDDGGPVPLPGNGPTRTVRGCR